jgi:tripartite ATP-independent transporter DctP family solute receptor
MFGKKFFPILLIWAMVGGAALPIDLAGAQEAKGAITIKLATVSNLPHPYSITANEFKKLIEKSTQGAIKVSIHPGGQLGGEYEYVQAMALGTLDATVCATPSYAGMVPEFEIFALPFLFQDYSHADRVFQGMVGKTGEEILRKKGLILLHWHESGIQGFYCTKRQIQTIKDMAGLTMRTMESKTVAAAMVAYGAKAVPIPFPEFYTAMQTGVVDGGENAIHTYYTAKHYEVAKYYTVSNHRYLVSTFLMGEKTWKKIPAAYHDKIRAAAAEASKIGMLEGRKAEEGTYKTVVEKHGVKLHVMSEAAKAEFLKAVEPLYQETMKRTGLEKEVAEIKRLRN